jgi:hypothetical protein
VTSHFRWIEDLVRDLGYGARSFRRSPGFAFTAVLSLSLGLGANAAVFNVLYGVLWKLGDSRYYAVHGTPQPVVWFTFQDAAPYMPTLHVHSNRVTRVAWRA